MTHEVLKCLYCGDDMQLHHKCIGAGLNSVTYYCNNCGAILLSVHKCGKKISSLKYKVEFEK